MSIDWGERKKRRDACWPKEERQPQSLRLLPLDEIYKALHTDVSACSEFVRASFRCRPDDAAVYDRKMVTIRRKDRDDGREYTNIIAAFDIDFSLSDTQLAKLFQNWCREQQREKGLKQKENRGQSSGTKRLRNELQSLGAWRLIQSGLTYKQAAKNTEEVSGKPLYAHPGEWSNAVNAAKELRYRYS
jgi:hypothetical protein